MTITASQRREQILELIHKEKQVRVSDLKDMFHTSGVTIRSDLIFLEKKGLIERNFGTVNLKEDQMKDVFDESHIRNLGEKKKIGEYAVDLISENESIMIYTGSTSLQIAKRLKDHKNLIVVTNSIITAYELGKKPVHQNDYARRLLQSRYERRIRPSRNPAVERLQARQAVLVG